MSTAMSTFFHPITLIGAAGESETIEALVDTEHLFALLPYTVLIRLDVYAPGSTRYKGQWRGLGQVQAEVNGEPGWITYITGAAGETPLIGRHTLDSFLLDVDEENQLVPRELREIRHV